MTRRRIRWEIYLEILEILYYGKGIVRTELMGRIGTTYELLKGYLSHLETRGLIRIISEAGRERVEITEKGKGVFKEYKKLMAKIKKLLV